MHGLPEAIRGRPPFARAYARHTEQLARLVCLLARRMSLSEVAACTHLGWDTVKEIVKSDLAKRYEHIVLRGVRQIAVDEIYLGRQKKFFTLVIDLDSGHVLWVAKGKGAAALRPFLRKLRLARAKVVAAACDMSSAYFQALLEGLPKAAIVFDHFHIIKLCNEKIDEVRRGLQREADTLGMKTLKGLRYVLLRGKEKLSERDAPKLQEALKFNQPLHTAYYLKEELRALWNQPGRVAMERYFKDWIERALACGVRPMVTLAKTLRGHIEGILNYAFFPISSAKMEGLNLKIKNLLRVAFGYRDERFFELRLLGLHETKRSLSGA
ncbi:MAG: ISL3 family transposase [Verrucomicrobia bacterium]|nr:ISL3 family transposase [Verrucomicrobiota bacterium]